LYYPCNEPVENRDSGVGEVSLADEFSEEFVICRHNFSDFIGREDHQ